MKRGILVLVTIFIALNGYGNVFRKSLNLKNSLIKAKHVNDTVTAVIINDNFVNQVLKRDLTIPRVLSVYHNINTYTKLVPGKVRPGIKDTIINLKKGNSTFSFLKTSAGNILRDAYIENNAIATGNITVGLTKSIFAQRVSAAHIGDVVIIEDKDRKHRFTYAFNEAGKLATITYELHVD